MKKIGILFAVMAAVIVISCGTGTPKANLQNDVDTMSYVIGMAQSQGLKEYLAQRMKVPMPARTRSVLLTMQVFRLASRWVSRW